MSDTAVKILEKPKTLGEARQRAVGVPMHNVGNGVMLPNFSDMQQVMEFSSLMAGAGVMVGPAVRGNPGACMAVTMIAARFNLDPFMLSTKAYITKNKAGVEMLAWEAQAINAMIMGSGVLEEDLDYEFTGEGVERQVRVFGKIKGAERSREIQSNKIKDIKVKNSPLWTSEPDQQLSYYGSRLWVRRHAPAVLMGIYSPEELDESTMRNITPVHDVKDPAQRLQARLDEAKPRKPEREPDTSEKTSNADSVDQEPGDDDPQGDLLSEDRSLPQLPEIRDPQKAHDNTLKAWATGAVAHVRELRGVDLAGFWGESSGIIEELKERLPSEYDILDKEFEKRLAE